MVSYTGAFSDTGAIREVSGTPKLKVLSYTGVAYLLFVGLSFVARDLGALRA
jgi:hypothetical protein